MLNSGAARPLTPQSSPPQWGMCPWRVGACGALKPPGDSSGSRQSGHSGEAMVLWSKVWWPLGGLQQAPRGEATLASSACAVSSVQLPKAKLWTPGPSHCPHRPGASWVNQCPPSAQALLEFAICCLHRPKSPSDLLLVTDGLCWASRLIPSMSASFFPLKWFSVAAAHAGSWEGGQSGMLAAEAILQGSRSSS